MATITIRNLDDALKTRLRVQAARHGRSMEAEARDILHRALSPAGEASGGLGSALHALFAPVAGADLLLPERDPMPEPPGLS